MNEREYFEWQDAEEAGGICLGNLEAILSDNGAGMTVADLRRSLYRYTDCGAWLSVQLHDGTWRHSHELDGIETGEVRALLVGSIIEGSDAEVISDPIELLNYENPDDAVKAFNDTVDWVDAEACAIWQEENDEEEG